MLKIEEYLENWRSAGLISKEQFEKITEWEHQQDRFKKANNTAMLLPYLATVFFILAAFTFVAANWSNIPDVLKLVGLIFTLILSSGFAYYFYEKKEWILGRIAGILAVSMFGTSTILIAQIYHLSSYSGFIFYLWSFVALGFALFFKEQLYLYYMLGLLGFASSYEQFSGFETSWLLYGLGTALLGYYVFKGKAFLLTYLYAFYVVITGLQAVLSHLDSLGVNQDTLLLIAVAMLYILYLFGFTKIKGSIAFAHVTTVSIFIFYLINQNYNYGYEFNLTHLIIYLVLYIGGGFFLMKSMSRDKLEHYPIESLILFFPFFMLFNLFPLESFFRPMAIITLLVIYGILVTSRASSIHNKQVNRYGLFVIVVSVLNLWTAYNISFGAKSLLFLVGSIASLVWYRLKKEDKNDSK